MKRSSRQTGSARCPECISRGSGSSGPGYANGPAVRFDRSELPGAGREQIGHGALLHSLHKWYELAIILVKLSVTPYKVPARANSTTKSN